MAVPVQSIVCDECCFFHVVVVQLDLPEAPTGIQGSGYREYSCSTKAVKTSVYSRYSIATSYGYRAQFAIVDAKPQAALLLDAETTGHAHLVVAASTKLSFSILLSSAFSSCLWQGPVR